MEYQDGESSIDSPRRAGRRTGGSEGPRGPCAPKIENDQSSDSPSYDTSMKEYGSLINEIKRQNRTIDELKEKLCYVCSKKKRTKCEEKEMRFLQQCLETENIKLHCLIYQAMDIQHKYPKKSWPEIPLSTTYDEDNTPLGLSPEVMEAICKDKFSEDSMSASCKEDYPSMPCSPRKEAPPVCPAERKETQKRACGGMTAGGQSCAARDSTDSSEEMQQLMRCAGLEDDCEKRRANRRSDNVNVGLDPRSAKRIIDMLKDLCGREAPDEKEYKKICKELRRCICMQERLATDNKGLEGEKYSLQKEVLTRDRDIECLQQKIQHLQNQIQQLMRAQEHVSRACAGSNQICGNNGGEANSDDSCGQNKSSSDNQQSITNRLQQYAKCADEIAHRVSDMQKHIQCMNMEMDSLKNDREQFVKQMGDPCTCQQPESELCKGKDYNRKSRTGEMEELKKNYESLLSNYLRCENELKALRESAKSALENETSKTKEEMDEAEIRLLRQKIAELEEEQEEFKCLIKEQGEQVNDYRHKYMSAIQKVEEQKSIIEKLEINNKLVEDQINMEILRIKTKFQDKLKELAQLPKLLENEQLKVANLTKDKDELESKLRLVCREYKALKLQLEASSTDNVEELKNHIKQLEFDLNESRCTEKSAIEEKKLMEDKLAKALNDIDLLRTETARIVARLKEKLENQRQTLQTRISCLEKNLAQCRASACTSINDREEVINDMKGQLNVLCYSFDAAQKQIKTLKDHIAFLAKNQTDTITCQNP